MQQSETELTPEQEQALTLLLAGQSDVETGEALGVSRQTVWRWRTQDPVFLAELNSRRAELWSAHADRLRALVPKALAVLECALDAELAPDNWRLAVTIIRMVGIGELAPAGETDPEAIERKRRRERADAKLQEQSTLLSEMIAGV